MHGLCIIHPQTIYNLLQCKRKFITGTPFHRTDCRQASQATRKRWLAIRQDQLYAVYFYDKLSCSL